MDPEQIPQPIRGNILDRLFMHFRILPKSDAFLLKTSILVFFVFFVWFVTTQSSESQVEVSSAGGSFIEGIVGTPRFVNPVLAVTRADKDMSALVYDGLMKLGPDGVLVPNLAESITISDDALTYNVILKQNVVFHDETPLTADDVAFTIGSIQNPALGSPLRSNFDGVIVEHIGDFELNIVLPEPYAPFIENLTFGILPKHVWKDASSEEFPFSQHNSEPIGSGPYKVSKINRNTSGIPDSYVLAPHATYHGESPKISELTLRFFSNEEKVLAAFENGTIDAVAGLAKEYISRLTIDTEQYSIVTIPLPRTFAVFFNQNKSAALRNDAVREALSVAVDRQALISEVLGGYGSELQSPIPPGFGIDISATTSSSSLSRVDRARKILRDDGWKINEETQFWEKEIDDVDTVLSFSIATVNNSVFEQTSEFLRKEWEGIGIPVSIKQFEQSDLTQSIVRPRDYEALLLGTDVGRSLDFYSFWHSSQRNDPGLNVALYANITTDSILSKVRTNTDTVAQKESLIRFAEEVRLETPALFLYSPQLLYIFPNRVTGATFTGLGDPSERFASIPYWFISTESVWPLFSEQ